MDDRDDKDGDNEGKETMMIKEYDDTGGWKWQEWEEERTMIKRREELQKKRDWRKKRMTKDSDDKEKKKKGEWQRRMIKEDEHDKGDGR